MNALLYKLVTINGLLTKCGSSYMIQGRNPLKNLMKWKWYIMKNKEVKVREKLGSTVICKHCGKPFTKKHKIEYYCSDECRHEVELAQWRARSQRYRDKKKQLKLEQEQQMEQNDTVDTVETTDTTVENGL